MICIFLFWHSFMRQQICNVAPGQSKVTKYTKNLATLLWPEEHCCCQVQPSWLNGSLSFACKIDTGVYSLHNMLLPKQNCPMFYGMYFSLEGWTWQQQRSSGQSNVARFFVYFATLDLPWGTVTLLWPEQRYQFLCIFCNIHARADHLDQGI